MSAYHRKGGHGGPRPNSGRPRGAKDKAKRHTVSRDQVEQLKAEGQELPLTRLLRRMNDVSEPERYRDSLAVSAAPYCHARLGHLTAAKAGTEMTEAELEASILRDLENYRRDGNWAMVHMIEDALRDRDDGPPGPWLAVNNNNEKPN
jgi:hypothetical protein